MVDCWNVKDEDWEKLPDILDKPLTCKQRLKIQKQFRKISDELMEKKKNGFLLKPNAITYFPRPLDCKIGHSI